ncbi:uncharacterized protein Dana_GF27655 [Drosophila ananassae]|uniref:Uncharacterized protein n=1 Tax=Drosophila ananassae TaxID=7217 RepID=A0A0N8P1F9_DROAN|nr:uncharacterized protein LOC26515064 [Drosophila ananassae]KPU79812.1 uncharacterized protein Dana_GF27655 [Drosophila ananassae]
MKTSWLPIILILALTAVLAEGDDGYLYGKPTGELLSESLPAVPRVRKHRLKPRVYPASLSQNCGSDDPEAHAAAVAAYHAARPPPRRSYNHQELVVDSSFFEPSQEAIDELRRVLLDQE